MQLCHRHPLNFIEPRNLPSQHKPRSTLNHREKSGSIGWFVKNIKKKTDTSLVLYLAVSITDSAEMGMHAEQEASVTSCIVDREIFSLKNGVCRIED
ncbi:hypothetical protein QYF36_015017 [Acer negundo]|nr:hypothetical protein QYF36_015017 [Acer negundo]